VTRPAHRPARPPVGSPRELELALWAAAGRWELAASRLERDPEVHQHGVDALRWCADELAMLLAGHRPPVGYGE
jgi:hypothetical protein